MGEVELKYDFDPGGYLLRVSGTVPATVNQLIITLPRGLRSEEADVQDDQRYLAFALKPVRTDARSVGILKA